jgi:diaphanous 2
MFETLKTRGRFQPIIQGEVEMLRFVLNLNKGLLMKNTENMRVACLTLINAIVSTPEDLDFRIHLRTEFVGMGW